MYHVQRLVLASIRFYQRYLSWDHGLLKELHPTDKICRFQPTCSEYTYQAVRRYGALAGLRLGFLRVVRCHPWSKGGYDPVK